MLSALSNKYVAGAIVALVGSTVGLAAAFGLPVTPEQAGAVSAEVLAGLGLAAAIGKVKADARAAQAVAVLGRAAAPLRSTAAEAAPATSDPSTGEQL